MKSNQSANCFDKTRPSFRTAIDPKSHAIDPKSQFSGTK